jgi:exonuclease SbcC
LGLRLAFALATLPQELGTTPGCIFLDEPLSSFDVRRTRALVDLITGDGLIARSFAQVVVISHSSTVDARQFPFPLRMDGGRVVESDLPAFVDAGGAPGVAGASSRALTEASGAGRRP